LLLLLLLLLFYGLFCLFFLQLRFFPSTISPMFFNEAFAVYNWALFLFSFGDYFLNWWLIPTTKIGGCGFCDSLVPSPRCIIRRIIRLSGFFILLILLFSVCLFFSFLIFLVLVHVLTVLLLFYSFF